MVSFLSTLLGWLLGPRPRLLCDRRVWAEGTRELSRRTLGGRQESGAYLLGEVRPDGTKRILDFLFYDDVDPLALASGVVRIRQTALPKVWEICRAKGYGVVADVHVHPGGYGQSESDRENPVMPRAGHIAMILPDFARGQPRPGSIGIYEFQGEGCWLDHSRLGPRFLKLDDAA